METRTALISILVISAIGLLFSGFLSYGEVFKGVCTSSELGMGTCTVFAGIPACVYGFVMYLIVFIISWIGLKSIKSY